MAMNYSPRGTIKQNQKSPADVMAANANMAQALIQENKMGDLKEKEDK